LNRVWDARVGRLDLSHMDAGEHYVAVNYSQAPNDNKLGPNSFWFKLSGYDECDEVIKKYPKQLATLLRNMAKSIATKQESEFLKPASAK